ncbi:MAG: Pvc16 family protein [Crocinitomicaceae bacterium]|nr:Pvc16 family protein [Crocinitomicaceae bacterium]
MNQTFEFISGQLNETLKLQLGTDNKMVTIGRLKKLDGTLAQESINKLLLSVVNISLEENARFSDSRMGFATQGKVSTQPVMQMNVYMLAAANYEDELEGLKMLRLVIQYFQANSFFDQKTNPALPEEIQKITLEACNLSLQDVESVWKVMGSNAVPSMLYKLRIHMVNDSAFPDIIPDLTGESPKKTN